MESSYSGAAPSASEFERDLLSLEAEIALIRRDLLAAGLKLGRSHEIQAHTEALLRAQRSVRTKFMDRHAELIYRQITCDGARYMSLAELIEEAAQRYPALVPNRSEMANERAQPLAARDGLEIDQAIFVGGILRSSQPSAHLARSMRRPSSEAEQNLAKFQTDGAIAFDTVLLERRGSAAHITLRNISCLNAENLQFLHDMEAAVDLALLNPEVSVGILRGGEMTHPKYLGRRVFCAGIHLGDLYEGRIPLIDFFIARELGLLSKLRRGLYLPHRKHVEIDKPWIAVVEGFAIGGGMQMVLAVDYILAAQDAYFSLPAANEGIVPGLANLRLPKVAGNLARRMILMGHVVEASTPEARLICDEIVSSNAIERALQEAVDLLSVPAATANKRMLNYSDEPLDQFCSYLAEFSVEQAVRIHSPDVLNKLRGRVL